MGIQCHQSELLLLCGSNFENVHNERIKHTNKIVHTLSGSTDLNRLLSNTLESGVRKLGWLNSSSHEVTLTC